MIRYIATILLSLLFATAVNAQSAPTMARSDSLFARGVELYNAGKYSEAIPLFTESDRIDKAILDSTSNRRDYSAMWLASCLFHTGDSVTAAQIDPDYYRFKPVDRRLTVKSDSLSEMGSEYYAIGDHTTALELYLEAAEIEKSVLGKNHITYANSLYTIGYIKLACGDKSGLDVLEEWSQIIQINYGTNSKEYANSIATLFAQNTKALNFDMGIKYGLEIIQIYKTLYGEANTEYGDLLKLTALCYAKSNKIREAASLGCKALKVYESCLGKHHKDYIKYLDVLASYYMKLKNYSEAIKLKTEKLRIEGITLGKNHPDYISSLANLAYNIYFIGNYIEAIRLGIKVVNLRKETMGTEHPDYAKALSNLALFYKSIGNYDLAIRIQKETLNICERILGKKHKYYALSLSNLASFEADNGNYSEALRLGNDVLSIREALYGKNHPDYATSLSKLASYHYLIGNYNEALKLATDANNIHKKTIGEVHPKYIEGLNTIANCYHALGENMESAHIYAEVAKLIEELYGINHPKYATALSQLASVYFDFKKYNESIQLKEKVLDYYGRYFGKTHLFYANSLHSLSRYYATIEKFSKAIDLEREALNIFKKNLHIGHDNILFSTLNLSEYYIDVNNIDSAKYYTQDATHIAANIIRKQFSGLRSEERRLYWNSLKSLFEITTHVLAYVSPDPDIVSSAYDGTLLAKGILLNSERDFSQLIQESGDAEALKLFNELRSTRMMLNRLYEKPIAERVLSTDSLEKVAADLERELIGRSRVYGDFTRNMAIGWKDVQRNLGKEDVAVEFVSFPAEENITTYAAYVIRPGMANPEMVTLFKKNSLDSISPAQYYRNDRLSRLVWQGLDKYLADAKNVYFAPAGELYNIAIESLPDYRDRNDKGNSNDNNTSDTSLLSDWLNLYRLSSTRELAVIKDKRHMDKSVLYGGLKYNTDAEVLRQDAERYPQDAERSFDGFFDYGFSLADSLQMRAGKAGMPELPWTMKEVTNIKSSLLNHHIDCRSFTGSDGTEGSFKALSGKGVNHLHIATHGFYWTESEAERKGRNLSFLSFGNDELTGRGHRNVEDKALTRSGLLLAGANLALTGRPLPENAQDGILTAREIAGMDMRGMDMVVLSACQTGLGEISGDGVFGLQRGFKKAGANTLLMSLWKVDDKATQLLMTKFYDELLSGSGKHDALLSAQRFVREYAETRGTGTSAVTVRPYAHPRYWAAFILLDAIDTPWVSQN